jgi:heme A synthase
MIFFCTLLYTAFRTRPQPATAPLSSTVRTATAAGVVAVYVQMLLGALIRHLGAGLACVEVPLCRGSLWPTNGTIYLPLHMLHRIIGVGVLLVLLVVSMVVIRGTRSLRMRLWALALPVLCMGQIALGLLSITTYLDVIPVSAHLGVAAALLALTTGLHLASRGPLGARSQPPQANAPETSLPSSVVTA